MQIPYTRSKILDQRSFVGIKDQRSFGQRLRRMCMLQSPDVILSRRPLPISIAFLAFISLARLAMNCACSQATIMAFQECSIVLWKQWVEMTLWNVITFYDIEWLIVPEHSSIPDTKPSLPIWGFSGLDAPSWSDWGHTATVGCLFPHSDF